MSTNERIFELLFEKDDVTWKSILFELVREEKMDPWDIDISLLAKRFFDMVKQLKEMNFRLSGKIILAAAILVRLKSDRLVGKDVDELDKLFAMTEDDYDESILFDEEVLQPDEEEGTPELIPKTPQPRKRKVSIYDLVDALNRALEVKRRNVVRSIPTAKVEVPEKKRDISDVIVNLYERIKGFFKTNDKLTFSQLIPSDTKEDKVLTFIPMLHLTNQRKIDIKQKEHFGDIDIFLRTKEEIDKELGVA